MSNEYNTVNVVDSPMGWGKTSWLIQEINKAPEKNYVVITPFLSETERIIKSCPKANFYSPDPNKGKGRKGEHFKTLLLEKKNIVSTHSLFANIDDEVLDALRVSNYSLIIDESFEAIRKYNLWSDNSSGKAGLKHKNQAMENDLRVLQEKNFVEIDPQTYAVSWIDRDNILWKYGRLVELSRRGLLYSVDNTSLMWAFPSDFFKKGIFKNIYVLTYQFKNQVQSGYCESFGIPVSMFYVSSKPNSSSEFGKDYYLKEYMDTSHEEEWKNKITSKIHILENDKMNSLGDYQRRSKNKYYVYSLGKNWYNKNLDKIPQIANNSINFFQNMCHAKASQTLWTAFSSHKKEFSKKRLSDKHWLAMNARATNEYENRTALAYLLNRNIMPEYERFFNSRGISFSNDGWAQAEMLQWIFRSAIRNGHNINIYMPSRRMRELYYRWEDSRGIGGSNGLGES